MNSNREQIMRLRETIYTALDPLIQNDYCLLDIPDHKNIGDNLIWAGELAYLDRLPYKMLYTANLHLCQLSKVPVGSTILLHGGGNFGDIWRIVQDFRNKVIQQFPRNKIIIMPQTVHYDNEALLQSDAAILNRHPDLTICARDQRSYGILKKHFFNANILLLPDAAFCLDCDEYIQSEKTGKALILERVDKELADGFNLKALVNEKAQGKTIEIKDWPTFNITRWEERLENWRNKADIILSKGLINAPVFNSLVDHRYGLKSRKAMESYIQKGIEFINEYDEIYTTRLHGFILAVLLNKKVYVIDNYYGKNSGFFDTWMGGFSNVYLMAKSPKAVG